jgi:hypothetical protein
MGWLQNILSPKKVEPKLDYENILRNYGAILETTSKESVSNSNILPMSKVDLTKILLAAIAGTKDQKLRESMKVCFISLGNFVELTDEQQDVVEKMDAILSGPPEKIDMAAITVMADKGDVHSALMQKAEEQRQALKQILQRSNLW